MANEFLISKWRKWHKALDVTKDGVLSSRDAEMMRDNILQLQPQISEESTELVELVQKWWNDFIFQGRTSEITEQDFVEVLSGEYAEDKAQFREMVEQLFDVIWNALDANGDGLITEGEYIASSVVFGHDNIENMKAMFKEHSPVDGVVPIETLKKEWVDFVTCDDSSRPNLAGRLLEIGLDIA